MKRMLKTSMCILGMTCCVSSYASPGIELLHQGTNTTIAKIKGDSRYVLLPIEENAPISEIFILKNGVRDKKFNVMLANNRIDYYVPLDITPYAGDSLVLDIRSHNDRHSLREAKDAVWNNEMKLSDTFDTTNKEKYRPAFHHTPLYGWMNDPNGMFYKDGEWHLYYQYNPFGSKWENMSWGHSSSSDLVHWEHHAPVLYPNSLGMIFSGSSVVDKNNTAGFGEDAVIALYTSADAIQMQSLAYSNDNGATFTNYTGNPVIVYERESRDPNMFWDDKNNQWVLLLASALDHEMLVFTSSDLKEWTLKSKFGNGYGSQDGVWECPDLMKLPVEGTDQDKWVLICNINPGAPFGGSGTQYFVGDFDGTTFTCDNSGDVTKWMDYGKDHYATVSFSNAPDGRHTVIGWMSNWQYANDVPTMQFRSANTLPREVSLFRAPDNDLYVASRPSPEVDALRGTEKKYGKANIGKSAKRYALPAANDGICEIDFSIELTSADKADLTLSNNEGEKVVMTVDASGDTFSMDRTASGLTDFSEHFPAVTTAPAHNGTKAFNVRIFVDRSSIEAFDGDGRFAMTNLVFPTSPYTSLSVSTAGGNAKIKSLNIYSLNPEK